MFERILVPLDGSPDSEKVCDWIIGIAESFDSVVDLLAVIDPSKVEGVTDDTPETEAEELVEAERQYAVEYLRKRVNWFQERRVTVASHAIVGDPAEQILLQARELDARLIAMATHRRSALMRGILGSVADRILHSTSVPIMLVRPGEQAGFGDDSGLPKTMIVPLDGSSFAERAISFAEGIASHTSGEVVFLTGSAPNSSYAAYTLADSAIMVNEEEGTRERIDDYLKRIAERSSRRGIKVDWNHSRRIAAEAIIDAAGVSRDRMVVMTTHGSSGLKRWLLGSIADKVIRTSEHPVLVIPPEHQVENIGRRGARRP